MSCSRTQPDCDEWRDRRARALQIRRLARQSIAGQDQHEALLRFAEELEDEAIRIRRVAWDMLAESQGPDALVKFLNELEYDA